MIATLLTGVLKPVPYAAITRDKPGAAVFLQCLVGWCRLPVSTPELNACLVSALETKM